MENTASKTTSSPSCRKTIKKALAEMALMRGAYPAAEVITAYVERLSAENLDDVLSALRTIQDLPRMEGELAFPEIGTILSVAKAAGVTRHSRVRADYYQQQVCPSCGSLVAMMRPIGEQFRTWCGVCKSYRKIVPEDLELTDRQWRMICAELEIIYENWVRRGSNPAECIDPQFDRRQVLNV